MDRTLAALQARYPRVQWRQEGDLYRGFCGAIHFRVWAEEADESSGLPLTPWWADGWTGGGSPLDSVGAPLSPTVALDRLAQLRPEYRAALHSAPAEPEEWEAPNMPGPAALGCPALAALMGLVVAFFGALCMGVELVRWLTGGAS